MEPKVDYQQLRDAALFQHLPEKALMTLADHCRYQELSAGETLFHQGDPGDALYVLQEGQIHVVRKYESGEDVVLATEGPYYVIGDLSGITGQPRTGSVVAVSDCTLIALSREDFLTACEQIPGMAAQVMMYLGQRLYRMNLLVREAAIGNIAARVASVLLLLSGGKSGLIPVDVWVTRVARAAAADADAVDRVLQNWVRKGYIEWSGRSLTIHNIETLHTIAG